MARPEGGPRPPGDETGVLLEHEPLHRRGVGLILVMALGVVLGATVWGIPRQHAPLAAVARQAMIVALPKWHTLEPVNEVVYGTRGFDTFGETFLLLAAVVSVGLVARGRESRRGFIGEEVAGTREQSAAEERPDPDLPVEAAARRAESGEQGRGHDPATPDAEALGTASPEQAESMTVVVRGAVRVIAPVLAVAGCYLVAWGYSPGGGFPGGAVLAGVVLLAYVSLGYRRIDKVVRPGLVEPIELAGALLIVLIELGGLVFKGSFSASFLTLGRSGTIPSGGILQAFSGSEFVEVGTGLTLAIFGLLGMAHDWAPDDRGAPGAQDAEGGQPGPAGKDAGSPPRPR